MAEPIKSDQFWEEEGDMILSVTEDGVETHFRIHSILLIIRSPIFRDLLSAPRPFKSLPLVSLKGDSLHDVKSFLIAVYYPQSGRQLVPVSFNLLLGILRFSHKYQMEELQKPIKEKLAKRWPAKFSDVEARLRNPGPGPLDENIALIENAKRCQVNELLPAAMYQLACAWGTRREEIIRLMSPENVARLCAGRARSEHRLKTIQPNSSGQMWQPSLATPERTIFHHRMNFPKCHKHPHTWCTTVVPTFQSQATLLLRGGYFAIPIVQHYIRTGSVNGCQSCKVWFLDVLKDKGEEMWDNIPIDFNLVADSEDGSSNGLLPSVNYHQV